LYEEYDDDEEVNGGCEEEMAVLGLDWVEDFNTPASCM